MARKTPTYRVTLTPADAIPGGGYSVRPTDAKRGGCYEVQADTLDELADAIGALAGSLGRSCAVEVVLGKGYRKPPGFDAFRRAVAFVRLEGTEPI